MAKIKNTFLLLLRISVSILLLLILFKINKIDFQDLANNIKGADKRFLCVGFLVVLISYSLGFLRWKMLVKAAGIDISLRRLITSFSGGVFFNSFMPSTIGGDLLRATDLSGETRKAKEVIATIFLDRLSGYVGLIFVIIPALLFNRDLLQDKVILYSVSAIIIILAVILLVVFNSFAYRVISSFLSAPGSGKIKDMLRNIHHEIHLFRNRKKMIIGNLVLSFFIQLIAPVSVYFIGLSLGVKVNPVYFFVFLPIIGAVTLLPIAFGGIGLREQLFQTYFAKVGVIGHLAVTMSILSFSFTVIYAAIGGLIYVLTIHRRRLQSNQPSRF
jgi:glycosyltransferase 2 family protein